MGLWDLPSKEVDAICFFQNCGILPKTRKCSKSHSMELLILNQRIPYWACSDPDCNMIPLRVGSWFDDGINIPLTTAVRFIYCWSKDLTTEKFCEEELDMQSECALHWNTKLREVCAVEMYKDKERVEQTLNLIKGKIVNPIMNDKINSPCDRVSYVAEYTWRNVQAEKEIDCFDAIIAAIVLQYPPEVEYKKALNYNESHNSVLQTMEINNIEIKSEPESDSESPNPVLEKTVVDNIETDNDSNYPVLRINEENNVEIDNCCPYPISKISEVNNIGIDNDSHYPVLSISEINNVEMDNNSQYPDLRISEVNNIDIEIKSEPESDRDFSNPLLKINERNNFTIEIKSEPESDSESHNKFLKISEVSSVQSLLKYYLK